MTASCPVCGHARVRIRRDGRFGAHYYGRARYKCTGSGRKLPLQLSRVSVRIMYRHGNTLTDINTNRFLVDAVSWDGPGHKAVEVIYDAGPLEEYLTRFDNRDPDLALANRHFPRYVFEWDKIPDDAWAAYAMFIRYGRLAGELVPSRRRQIEQAIGSDAAYHEFALPG